MFDGDISFYSKAPDELGLGLDSPEFCWLQQLVRIIPQATAGFLLIKKDSTVQVAAYPESTPKSELIQNLLLSTCTSQSISVTPVDPEDAANTIIAVPVPPQLYQGAPGAIAVEVDVRRAEHLKSLANFIQSSLAWLAVLKNNLAGHTSGPKKDTSATSDLMGVLATCYEQSTASASALILATALTKEFNAEQFAVIHNERSNPHLIALSGIADFDPKRQSNQALLQTMSDINSDCGQPLVYQVGDEIDENNRPLAEFAAARKCQLVFSYSVASARGSEVRTLAHWVGEDQTRENLDLTTLVHFSNHALSILALQFDATPGFLANSSQRLHNLSQAVVGPAHLKKKCLSVLAVVILAALCLVPIDFRISAPINLEGASQRAVVAPFDSFVSAAHAQAGMEVSAGSPLVELDTTELRLNRDKWLSERAKFRREYDRALSELNHAEARILSAQIAQTEAELHLVEAELKRATLHAPFDGVVISGDLSRSIGAPLERGEVLLEVAPLNGYRVVLSVDERDIFHVQPEQTGELTLSAMPQQRWPFVVKTVASAAPGDDDVRRFRVEADLLSPSAELRPGMQGVGKITVGESTPAEVATRRFWGWLQLNLWSRLP